MEKGAEIEGISFRNYREFGAMDVSNWRVNTPKVQQESCVSCGLCVSYCPENAISLDGKRKPVINFTFCKGCGICAHECPTESIEMVRESS